MSDTEQIIITFFDKWMASVNDPEFKQTADRCHEVLTEYCRTNNLPLPTQNSPFSLMWLAYYNAMVTMTETMVKDELSKEQKAHNDNFTAIMKVANETKGKNLEELLPIYCKHQKADKQNSDDDLESCIVDLLQTAICCSALEHFGYKQDENGIWTK